MPIYFVIFFVFIYFFCFHADAIRAQSALILCMACSVNVFIRSNNNNDNSYKTVQFIEIFTNTLTINRLNNERKNTTWHSSHIRISLKEDQVMMALSSLNELIIVVAENVISAHGSTTQNSVEQTEQNTRGDRRTYKCFALILCYRWFIFNYIN